MNGEIMRIIDAIHRDKSIDREILFAAVEEALLTASRKTPDGVQAESVSVDRMTGDISALSESGEPMDLDWGRIAAQSAKQLLIQKFREAENDVIFGDFEKRKKQIASGTVHRIDGNNVIVNLGKTEGILPPSEQVPTEPYRVGERLRCYVLDVKRTGARVRIVLSRTHPDLLKRLFELEVPEISDHTVEIRGIVREPGYRAKVAVYSADSRVDCVGACVGVRGIRIKSIVDELNGEKIDIVRWSDSPEMLVANALKPAEPMSIHLASKTHRARVVVAEESLSRAIGRRGQNVRLASRLTGWEVDVMSPSEIEPRRQRLGEHLKNVSGIGTKMVEAIWQAGFSSVRKIANTSVESLTNVPGLGATRAADIIAYAIEHRDDDIEHRPPPKTTNEGVLANIGKPQAEAEEAAPEETVDADESEEAEEATTDETSDAGEGDEAENPADEPAEEATGEDDAPDETEDTPEETLGTSETAPEAEDDETEDEDSKEPQS